MRRWQAALTVMVVVAGCRTPGAPAQDERALADPVSERAPPTAPTWSVAGFSVEGRPIDLATFRGPPDSAVVLFLASIHGNETAGTPLLYRLIDELERRPESLAGRTAALVPLTNPDGVQRRSRHNARGVDLNRNFPAENWRERAVHGPSALSEPESRAIHDLIDRLQPTRVLSFHQAANTLDYDGPARELAHALEAVGPLKVKRLGSHPGSLGSYCGLTLGIPIMTVEMTRADDRRTPGELWERYGEMLLAALRHE